MSADCPCLWQEQRVKKRITIPAVTNLDLGFFASGDVLVSWQVGAGASAATKEATASTMGGPAKGDAKAAEESDKPEAEKADQDLDRLAKKDPERFKKAVSAIR